MQKVFIVYAGEKLISAEAHKKSSWRGDSLARRNGIQLII
jgi:hypothetical protein